jgi:hypothetical protein
VASLACSKDPEGDYRILGDDIVICGNKAAAEYKTALHKMKCVISAPKSLTSSKVSEFAGRVITPRCVMHGFKWRNVSDDSFLDYLSNVGPCGKDHLRPRQQAVAGLLAEIPRDLGGLGWNPEGKPYDDRYRENRGIVVALASEQASPMVNSSDMALTMAWVADLQWPAECYRINPPVVRGKDGSVIPDQPSRFLRTQLLHSAGVKADLFRDEDPSDGYSPALGTLSRVSKLSQLEARLRPWLENPDLDRSSSPETGYQQMTKNPADKSRMGILGEARRVGYEKAFAPLVQSDPDEDPSSPGRPDLELGLPALRRRRRRRDSGPSR